MQQNVKYLFFIIGLAILVMLFMDFTQRVAEVGKLKYRKEQVIQQVTQLAATSVYLQTKISYVKSDEMALSYAYRERRMIKEGDVRVVVLPDAKATPKVTPTPFIMRNYYSNWEYWKALFIDPDS